MKRTAQTKEKTPKTPRQELVEKIEATLAELKDELLKACLKHGPMASPHEGISVIREEVDELWDHVKRDTGRTEHARKEALQIAAMGIRYALDVAPL